jgi:hypothetical protein
MTRGTFGSLIKEYNRYVRDKISTKGAEYLLPERLGKIQLRKVKTEVKIDENGNIVNNLPINWKETRELWASNPETKKSKTKIRFTNEHTDGHTFRVSYYKFNATYKNKSIYRIKFNRTLKRDLSKSIFKGNIDAFLNKH